VKRKADDIDEETQPLEANKRRLLAQHSWTGVAPSQPRHLNFPSSNEKSQIDKRRRVQGKRGATARYREQGKPDSVTQQLQPAGDQQTRTLASGALRGHPGDIRIRIGTDALTTACSTHPRDSAPSEASSEPMLFDQHIHHTKQPDLHKTAKPNLPQDYRQNEDCAWNGKTLDYKEHSSDERAQYCHSPRRLVRVYASQDSPKLCGQGTQQVSFDSVNHVPTVEVPTGQDATSELHIMQQVDGVGRGPLRFVFTHSTPTAKEASCVTGRNIDSGGTNHALDAAHAGEYQGGLMHHLGDKHEVQFNKVDATAAIVDEKSWKLLVDVPDNSSTHTGLSIDSERSALQSHATARTRGAEHTSWSQHATQGDQTHISSSIVSASLPSLRQIVHRPDAGVKCRNNKTAPILDEDEQLWQDYVFGNNEQLSSETIHKWRGYGDQRTERASSGYLPLSVAVSSIKRTPFNPMSVQACRRGDGVHDTAISAPPSKSFTSPVASLTGFAEEFYDEEEDADVAACTAFGEYSVAHASLLNNASGDTHSNFWRTSSRTGMSRSGPEHANTDRDSLLERETGWGVKPSSAYDIPDSDDEGLDLVDASRLF
jgi:hypothetical protein